MPPVSRRNFLKSAALLAAATGLPLEPAEAVLAAEPSGTTLDRVITRGGSGYSTLGFGPGEPHRPIRTTQCRSRAGPADPKVLCAFVQFTDVHIIDAQSPLRVELLDRTPPRRAGRSPTPARRCRGRSGARRTMTTQVVPRAS